MNIAILGFGSQGQSAYDYWNTPENDLTICDSNEDLQVPTGVKSQLGEHYLNGLDRFDLLIRTPALHPNEIVNANEATPDILSKVWSNTNEFFKVCPTKNIVGVTGTKGKGTTSSLLAEMLKAAGKTVHLGGNIGIPPLEMLKNNIQPDDIVVLELANFQLIDLQMSPHIAVCLMMVPEHMDWHTDFEDYKASKKPLFEHQIPDDIAIYYADNNDSLDVAATSSGLKIPYFAEPGARVVDSTIIVNEQFVAETSSVKLLGGHNLQNVCAAITAFWQMSHDTQAIRWALETFSGLEHRLEKVATINGVDYYDDSFGTTPETAVVAIEAFEQQKVVILGGSDKKANYEKLAKTVKNHGVRKAILIGDTAPAIQRKLEAEGFKDYVLGPSSMNEIVQLACENAQSGDVVLLSTGCASFGLFANYKDRGDQFKQAVQALDSNDSL